MSHELSEGVKLKSVSGPGPNEVWERLGAESHHCSEIVVSEQVGEMSMVPWAKCTKNNGEVVLVNLGRMETVTLLEADQ